MKKLLKGKTMLFLLLVLILAGAGVAVLSKNKKPVDTADLSENVIDFSGYTTIETLPEKEKNYIFSEFKESMPIYGNWKNFTEKDGLP
ncbi:MAG: hypothetical protein HPY62_06475, partial [Bacteroidales bacterium]|nr:hypothetical protein [Bacteroidales bacterium]